MKSYPRMKAPSWKIDWPNHAIGFFSALFGILIAFELDEWRERNNDFEVAAIAYGKLKQEVGINQSVLHETVSINLDLIALLEERLLPRMNEKLLFTGTEQEADSLNADEKFSTIAFIHFDPFPPYASREIHIGIGNLLQPTLHYSAWESAKATGALNFMKYEKVLALSSIYNAARINDELAEIKALIHLSDRVQSKSDLMALLTDLRKAFNLIEVELAQYDVFVNMLNQMD